MLETMKKIKNMNIKSPEIKENTVNLNNKVFFNFQKKEVKKTAESMLFIEKLKENCHTDMNDYGGFGSFFFDLNGAYLEIFISIEEETISIVPYLVYDKEIAKNIQRIIYREFFLYCLFKKYLLQ